MRGGIDLGGTKIQAVVIDGRSKVLGEHRMPTPKDAGPEGVVWALAWFAWFRDSPSNHPAMSTDELSVIAAGQGAAPSTGAAPVRFTAHERSHQGR